MVRVLLPPCWFLFLAAAILTVTPDSGKAQDEKPQRGLIRQEAGVTPGYTMISPLSGDTVYLINSAGKVVHQWKNRYEPGLSSYLLPNGNLLRGIQIGLASQFRGGGISGGVQELNWNGELLWEFHLANDRNYYHHDFEPLPNGNILLISWEAHSKQEVLAVGRKPEYASEKGLWPDAILEIEPLKPYGAKVVWEWHVWDHLIQDTDANLPNYGLARDHPERVDINADLPRKTETTSQENAKEQEEAERRRRERTDWLHFNGIDYHAELDQIVVSSHVLSEIWIIDHSTTTAEAAGSTGGRAGRGGDLLYRWGNPQIYGRGTEEDQQLFHQHNPEWIPAGFPGAGDITVFNNGRNRTGGENYSTVVQLSTPVKEDRTYAIEAQQAFLPTTPSWEYNPPKDNRFYASFISGAHRTSNGNTLICSGPTGRVFEVTPAGDIVWEFKNPFTSVDANRELTDERYNLFRATRIPPDHPALSGRALTPIDPQPKSAAELFAELPRTEWKPLESPQPEIHDDGMVTFRIQAPKAERVLLRGDWLKRGEELEMSKDDDGVWTASAGPFPPGNHIYGFETDGAPIPDPENASVKLRATRAGSFFHISGDAIWEPRDVPHGNVEINFHLSQELGDTRWYSVYTPPGYQHNTNKSYPVLYLLHGSNDTAIGWVMIGAANFILDNLIAEASAQEMIVVMPFGHAVPHGSPREVQATNTDRFEQYLLNDVVPLVESKYRVQSERKARAIAGLSMGGGQAIAIGLRNQDRFSAIGSFSGSVPREGSLPAALEDSKRLNDQLALFWLGCGRDDFLIERNETFVDALAAGGVRHEFHLTDGVHNYAIWRRYLSEFVPRLFQTDARVSSLQREGS